MTSAEFSDTAQRAREAAIAAAATGESDGPAAAIAAYDTLIEAFAGAATSDSDVREVVARSRYNRAVTLIEMGEDEKARAAYLAVADTYDSDTNDETRYWAVASVFNRALSLDSDGRAAEAAAGYRMALDRFRNDTYGDVATVVGRAMMNLALLSEETDGLDARLAVYREVTDWCDGDPLFEKQSVAASARHFAAQALKGSGRTEAYLAAVADLVTRYTDSPHDSFRLFAAKGLVDSGFMLGLRGRDEESAAAYRKFFERFRDDEAPGMDELRMTAAMTVPGAR